MKKVFKLVLLTLVLILIGSVGLISYNWDTVSANLKMKTTEKVLDEVANNVLDLDMDVSKVMDTLDSEEKEELVDLMSSYVTDSNVKKIASYVTSGDLSGAKSYVMDLVQEEDVDRVMELYQSHESEIKSYIGNPEKMDELVKKYGNQASKYLNQ